jgi:hypothetical protein
MGNDLFLKEWASRYRNIAGQARVGRTVVAFIALISVAHSMGRHCGPPSARRKRKTPPRQLPARENRQELIHEVARKNGVTSAAKNTP